MTVRRAAANNWPRNQQLITGPVKIIITHFYKTSSPDVDNIIKPIQDALIGLVYVDDSQVVESVGRKRSIERKFILKGISKELVEAIFTGVEFVHVSINPALNLDDLN